MATSDHDMRVVRDQPTLRDLTTEKLREAIVKHPRVDKLLGEGRTTYDQAARKKIYDEVQEIIVKDSPMLSLFYSVEYGALRDTVQDFQWVPDQIPRFRDLWKKKG